MPHAELLLLAGNKHLVGPDHSTRAKKYFLCLMCGPPSTSTSLPKAKGLDRGSESEGSSDADEEAGTVCSLCHSMAACFLICHPVSNLQLAQVV